MQQSPNSLGIPDWGSFAIALVALVQPWVMWLYRKYRAGTVHIYETGNIEIGYSVWGPTVGLLGTLRATDHDVFVRQIRLVVIRQRDNATQHFEWKAFRTGNVTLGEAEKLSVEPVAGFLLTTASPRQYNVFFSAGISRPNTAHQFREWAQSGCNI